MLGGIYVEQWNAVIECSCTGIITVCVCVPYITLYTMCIRATTLSHVGICDGFLTLVTNGAIPLLRVALEIASTGALLMYISP